jgi:hypothetical protein
MSLKIKIILLALVILFAWFVWPTPYERFGRFGQINRFTGAECSRGESCWKP